jgi:AraC-like DNA-binding protein
MMVQPRTYSITLRKAFKYLLGQGVHEQALLKGTELARRNLDDPYCQITENQVRVFFRNVLANTDQDGIGLEIGWLTGLSDVGQFGMMQITARTVREAIGKSHESRALYYLLGDWDYREEGGELIVSVVTREHEPALHRLVIELGIAIIQAHAEELSGVGTKPSKLRIDYARPKNFDRYQEIFACPIKFNQPACEIYYPAEILDREVETYDPQVSEVLSSLRENLLAKLSSRGDIVHEVKLELRRDHGQFPSLEDMAGKLAMSSRTLRRRLKGKDTSFQALLDEERHQVAKDFLLQTTMNIQQIAEHCGFSDAQNFSQAFKRWQGVSPTEYRETSTEG